MEETQQNFSYANADPETTLMQPRFDATEAQTARPVVPLSRVASWQRRTLPVALVVVSALIGGLVSVVAYRLYQRPAPTQTQAQTRTQTQTPTTEQPAAINNSQTAQTAQASAPTTAAPVEAATPAERREIARADTTTKAEESSAKDEKDEADAVSLASKKIAADEKRAERRAEQDARATHESAPHARRVDVITSPYATQRDRRRDDETTDQIQPDPRDARHPRRARGRNIDRIRDIFGAPPPADQ